MNSTTPLPSLQPDEVLSAGQRRALVVGMLGAHVVAGWALLQLEPVRQAMGELAPVFVDWVAPPTEVPPAPLPPPKPLPQRVVEPPPLVTAAPSPAPATFVAPPPPPEPPPVVAEAATPAPPAPPVPPAPPKTVSITEVEYLTPPQLNYPMASQRLRESGTVLVRVTVDARGLPAQMVITRSAGFQRLDDAALATVRATRFKPRTENGVAVPFTVNMPLIFEL